MANSETSTPVTPAKEKGAKRGFRGFGFMSSNQSSGERTESGQYRKTGRSSNNNNNQQSGGGVGSTGAGGGAPSAPSRNRSRSFKRYNNSNNNGQGGQARGGGPSVNANSMNQNAAQSIQNVSHLQQQTSHGLSSISGCTAPIKQVEAPAPKITNPFPKAPPSGVSMASSETSTPMTPAKAPGGSSQPITLQFGTTSPNVVNGMHIPARTSSAPYIDEQKREQARHQASGSSHNLPTSSIPKQQVPKLDVGTVRHSTAVDSHSISKPKADEHVSAVPASTQVPKPSIQPSPRMPVPVLFHQQQQVPLQFSGPPPQMQSQVTVPMHIPVPLPMGNPRPSMFVSHPMPPPGLIHQGQGFNFSPPMPPQMSPQLGNMGMSMSPQFHQHQAGKFCRPHKVKITHPETHEELRFDGSPPVGSTQANSHPPPQRSYNNVTVKPSAGWNKERDTNSLTSASRGAKHLGPGIGLSFPSVTMPIIESAGESVSVDQIHNSSGQEDAILNEKDEIKIVPDNWEDAADISTPKMEPSQHENQVDGEVGMIKKYSRDFLLKFSERSNDIPEGFEITSHIAQALMSLNANVPLIFLKVSESKDIAKDAAAPKGGKKKNKKQKKDIFKRVDAAGATSDLYNAYKGPDEKKENMISVVNKESISCESVDQIHNSGGQEEGIRPERRANVMVDEDKWSTEGQGSFVSERDIGAAGNIMGHRPGSGGNIGVMRGAPQVQLHPQYPMPLLPGVMHPPGPPGPLRRNKSESERWQGLLPYPQMPQTPPPIIHRSENKYLVGKVTDEEQAKQRQLKGILNKLTPQNFEKLFEQVKELNIDNLVTLNGVISHIFDKALMEPTFCEMYANFCFHLAAGLPDLSVGDEKITFKRLLLNKCQEEFERGEREQEEANKAEEEGEVKQSEEEREEKRLWARRRMLGNIRLIGELYKKRMLTERIMHECIKKLLGGPDQIPGEEDLEALCILMSTIGGMIDHPRAKVRMDVYLAMMAKLSTNMKLSSRVRFMMRDSIDLRKNKWQQRRKVEGQFFLMRFI